MSRNKHIPRPPRWAKRLLEWYCRPELLEDLQGDLNEYFGRNVKTKGAARAKIIYILDVLKFFRGYTIRKPEFLNLLTHWIMIGSYIKTSSRSIVRNKLFSAINIMGLAVSMSVGLLIIGMISDLFSYDKFHENHDRIYRVTSHHHSKSNNDMATTSLKAARTIKESFAGVEDVAIMHRDFSGDVTFAEHTIPLAGFWANETFFNVFSFQLLKGNPATALKEPFSVVLTEKAARKLVGDINALGKTITLNKNRDYTITGILKDIPDFSHMKFEMLGSLSTREITEKDNKEEMAWDNIWGTWAYVLMEDHADIIILKKNLDKLSAEEDKKVKNTHIELDLQPLNDIMTGENLSNQIGAVMGGTVVWILTSLSFIVVLCACLNYTNLSIARSFKRSREIGIRKTIGALKSHVVNQFIIESIMIALLALGFSLVLFLLVKPYFISIEPSLQELLVLDLSPKLVVLFVLFALAVGVCAGFFPAMFFGNVNAVQVLKNLPAAPVFKGVTLRKVLIVFQYSISIMAITATLILYNQYKHFIAYDLGFSTENILNIRLQGNKAAWLKKELRELPEVKDISQSLVIAGVGNNYWSTNMKNPGDPQDSAMVYFNTIDENYLRLHNLKLIAGQNFTAKTGTVEETEIIVNQQVLKRFNIAEQHSENAIGEIVKVDGKGLKIIGVVKDFEFGRANDKNSKEVFMRYSQEQAEYLNVKIISSDWPATYSKIEAIWKNIDPVHVLEAKFYDEQIEEAFVGLKASLKVGGFLAFLVICISSFGLLGMVVYTTEIRVREISIRKVLGASERRLLYLLSKGFLLLLFVSSTIALPATYLFFDKLLLPQIANHAPVRILELLAGVLTVMCIALFMIGSQTLKAARANPAEVLKNE